MGVKTVRRLAADILGVGEKRIYIDPESMDRVKEALTRDDVRALIKEGIITKRKIHGVSRARARRLHEQRKKGRRRGRGSIRGKKYSKVKRKRIWMNKLRAQRKLLKLLREKGAIKKDVYRRLYGMAKGGAFKSKSALLTYLQEHGLAKEASIKLK
ncbi:MAG: 50S ribosomal protein L19e [Candidatus Micrarchaeia archaeon]